MLNNNSEIHDSEINPDKAGDKLIMDNYYKEAEKELNSKIQNITLKSLSLYYESLDVLLNKYIKENPINPTL